MGNDKKLNSLENFWYYLNVFLTLGFWYTVKVVVKKAIIDAEQADR